MKKLIITTVLTLLSLPIVAQNIQKKFTSTANEKGTVYFIFPQKGFGSRDAGVQKDLVYDLTYVTYKDSVTYNFTYWNRQASPIDSVSFVTSSGGDESLEFERLYTEPNKNKWVHRVSLKIPEPLLREFYAAEQPYQIALYTRTGTYRYTISQGKWLKQRAIVNRILEMIDYNN